MPAVAEHKQKRNFVLVLSRTKKHTVFIGIHRNVRKVLKFGNREFDIEYRLVPHDYVKAASTWLKSTKQISQRAKEVLQMLIQIKAGKVIGKFEDGTVLEEAKGVKVFDGPEGLAVLRMSGMVKLHNNLVDEGNMVKGFESIDQACATTWDAMVNFEIPEPVAKGKKEKAAKEPRQPKVYNIEPKDEAHEYKEGTKMRQMVDALVEGATFADLATLIDTKVENVQHRVLRLMPQAGYGIYNTAEDPKTFFITIPPYKVKPVSEAAAKKAEEKAAKEAEKEAKAAEKAAAKAEKEAAKAAEKEAKAKEKEEAKKAKEAEKEAKAKEKAE